MADPVLILRTCDRSMRSHGGFQWPDSGPVSAPDWRPTITGGDGSTITGGDGSTIFISWYDASKDRMRAIIAYVGEDGILPNVAYRVDGGKIVELKPAPKA